VTDILLVVAPVLHTKLDPAEVTVSVVGVPEQMTPLVVLTEGLADSTTLPLAVAVQPPMLVAVTV